MEITKENLSKAIEQLVGSMDKDIKEFHDNGCDENFAGAKVEGYMRALSTILAMLNQ